jgi:DNA-binding response OmpR family regulator
MTKGHTDILIVEDDPDFQKMIIACLEHAGYKVRAAGNGEDGLALYAQCAPKAVVLDVNLPDMSGFDICRKIRADGPKPETPVIMCTVRSEIAGVAEGLGCGATDYVLKPFQMEDLLSRLRRAMDPEKGQSSHNA